MKTKKNGISLIVLVITIIIMIILASTIILNLSGINIIERVRNAIKEHNRKQIETLAQTIVAKGYASNKTEASIKEQIVKEIGKDKTDDFNIVVTNTGLIVESFPEGWENSVSEVINGVPIPKGFVISPYRGENKINEGIVIYALSEEEIDQGVYDITKKDEDYQYSLENRNQFVWVPVDRENFKTQFVRDRFEYDIDARWGTSGLNDNWYSNILGTANEKDGYFWEVELDNENMPKSSQSNMNFMSGDTLKEVKALYESVKEYGGFYIGRYEAGGTIVDEITKFGRGKLSITMGKYPYNGIEWAQLNNMNLDKGGVVQFSREIYPVTNIKYGAASTLTYGVQWDRTVAWMKNIKGEEFDLLDSTECGNYENTELSKEMFNENSKYISAIFNQENTTQGYFDLETWKNTMDFTAIDEEYIVTTGAMKDANICNIYDMAGNMYEWTMEGDLTHGRVLRGGHFNSDGRYVSIISRFDNYPTYVYACTGFRPSLYIK